MNKLYRITTLMSVFLLCLPACSPYPGTDPLSGPAAGNPEGNYPLPPEAQAVDVSQPDQVVGTGSPESCTQEAFIQALAQGGKIVFNGGPRPFTITLNKAAQVFNNKPDVVIDGGGLVTLSGGGKTRIIYMNTSDPDLVWTTEHAQNQEHPQLCLQNITLIDGNAEGISDDKGGGSGGAVYVYGGRLKIINCRFFNNRCDSSGPDVGGGAVRALAQYNSLPVIISGSSFGGAEGYGNSGSNGGAISSIMVSWSIYNSLFSHNSAIGRGGNPAEFGSPGGGSGGAIYNDGLDMNLALYGCLVENNSVVQHGAAIFFVSNSHQGRIHIEDSILRRNSGGSWYRLPGISAYTETEISSPGSTIED